MKELQKKNITRLVIFWILGLMWIFILVSNQIERQLPKNIVIALSFSVAAICLAIAVYLIHSVLQSRRVFKEKSKTKNESEFWFSDAKESFEYEDERTLQISETASRKSSDYASAFIMSAIMIPLFTDIRNVPTIFILLAGLVALTIKELSYLLIWKKEYYR